MFKDKVLIKWESGAPFIAESIYTALTSIMIKGQPLGLKTEEEAECSSSNGHLGLKTPILIAQYSSWNKYDGRLV